MAVVHGLGAALSYVELRAENARPDHLRVHLDNRCIYLLMIGDWKPGHLAPYHRAASSLSARLFGLGVPVGVVKVSEKHDVQRIVHAMTKQAPDQVLLREEWRPRDEASNDAVDRRKAQGPP